MDDITGFIGVIVAKSEYAIGCKHVSLQSKILQDGKPKEWESFDESRVILVSKNSSIPDKPKGGPVPKLKGEQRI